MPPRKRQIEMTWRCSSCGHRNLGRHKACQECNNPKDASEKYEMPQNTAAAPTVTDEALLRMATAGPNWRCAYCGSDQRAGDGRCAECGASPTEPPRRKVPAPPKPKPSWLRRHRVALGAALLTAGGIKAAHDYTHRTRSFDATVEAVRWEHTIVVERFRIWDREGWRLEISREAFEVVSLGQQVHHYDDVLDGYDTEYYTEQVACGEDCRTVPESCHESCSDNGNGFATCETTCSGGGQECSTRYCSEQRSRQVPRYRKEPRYAERVKYRIWDWGEDRRVHADGAATTDLRWPVDEARIGVGLPPEEKERERREGRYQVTLVFAGGEHVSFEVSAEGFAGFAIGSKHPLAVSGDKFTVDGVPVKRLEG